MEFPTFARRSQRSELMDDLSVPRDRLRAGLHGLRPLNRWLGGYSAVWSCLEPYLRTTSHNPVRILDVGAGVADIPVFLIRRANRYGRRLEVTAVDNNPAVVECASEWLSDIPETDRGGQLELMVNDLFSLPFEPGTFDICTASLFLHHLENDRAVRALRTMARLSRHGCVISDLHRTPAAYYGLRLVNRLMSAPEMVVHDGPISILRGFRRRELERLAIAAGWSSYEIRWKWAFRWTLSTVDS